MLRKLVYKGNKQLHILYPMDEIVSNGTELTVDNKEHADMLIELGFEEVATGKEKIEKKTKKKEGEE
jgi:hypothetical protein